MANPPKQKGTRFETEVVRAWEERFPGARVERMKAGNYYDVLVLQSIGLRYMNALVTRPDRGQRLYTLNENDLMDLVEHARLPELHIEAKRRGGSLWHHKIYEEKFGR